MLKDKHVLACIWLVAAINGMLFSYYAEAPFIFIRLIKLTESQYGCLGLIIALAALLGSLSSRHLIKKISVNKLMAIGCFIMLFSSGLFLTASLSGLINTTHPIAAVSLIMMPMAGIIFGSFGFVIPLTLSTALQKYKAVLGTAGALFGLSYYIIIAALTGIMAYIHNGTVFPMPIYFFVLSVISIGVFYGSIRASHN